MAKRKKTAKQAEPSTPFAIGETVQLVSGGPSMTVVNVWKTCGDSFFVNVAFFGQTEASAAQLPLEKALVERVFDSRVLMRDSDIPF